MIDCLRDVSTGLNHELYSVNWNKGGSVHQPNCLFFDIVLRVLPTMTSRRKLFKIEATPQRAISEVEMCVCSYFVHVLIKSYKYIQYIYICNHLLFANVFIGVQNTLNT